MAHRAGGGGQFRVPSTLFPFKIPYLKNKTERTEEREGLKNPSRSVVAFKLNGKVSNGLRAVFDICVHVCSSLFKVLNGPKDAVPSVQGLNGY